MILGIISALVVVFAFLILFFRRLKVRQSANVSPDIWPDDFPPFKDFAQQVFERTGLPATVLVPDRSYRPTSPFATWIGRVIVGLPGEQWPQANELPMIGVCQLNLTDAPFVPDSIKEYTLITFFVSRDVKREEYEPPYEASKWELRAYTADQVLVPYQHPPPFYKDWKPCAARSRLFTDYFSNMYDVLNNKEFNQLSRYWKDKIDDYVREELLPSAISSQQLPEEITWGTKLGGWPAPIQSDIDIPLAFQIGSEPETQMNWVDGGCIYIWRNDGNWNVDVEFY